MKINVDENNLDLHGDLESKLEKLIDHLPDSDEEKSRWILHG